MALSRSASFGTEYVRFSDPFKNLPTGEHQWVSEKFIFQHFNYGLILLGLNLFAVRINQFIVRQIQLKRDFNSLKCCYTIILIACTLALSFHAFSSFKIWRVLIGQPITNSDQDGFSWMVWLVLYADTVLKLASMGLKLISIQASVFMCLFKRVNFK